MLLIITILGIRIDAAPSGASITYLSNSTKAATSPDNRTDAKGTITVLRLNTVQQNDRWKAYVGNVTGVLTLDDADGYTIYDWSLTGSVSGTVFASRNDSIVWANVNCSNMTHTAGEETFLGISGASSDSIRNTFTSTDHTSFLVGDNTMALCNYTALYVNDTVITADNSAQYQEVTLYDGSSFIYASRIKDDGDAYTSTENSTFDFQMVVADYVGASVATYFFFVELQ